MAVVAVGILDKYSVSLVAQAKAPTHVWEVMRPQER